MEPKIDLRQLKLDARSCMAGRNPSVYLVTLVYLAILYVLGALTTRLMYPGIDFGALSSLSRLTEEQAMEFSAQLLNNRPGFIAQLLDIAIEVMGLMLGVGFVSYALRVSRGQEAGFAELFDAFGNFLRLLLLEVLIGLFVFLWSLLLVVPGLIAAYRYSMAVYIMLDNPDKGPLDCLRESKELMRGRKGELFLLDLSFLVWYLLSLIPFVSVFVRPYTQVTRANFYRAVSGRWEEPPHIDIEI